jgi:hypothetical protein
MPCRCQPDRPLVAPPRRVRQPTTGNMDTRDPRLVHVADYGPGTTARQRRERFASPRGGRSGARPTVGPSTEDSICPGPPRSTSSLSSAPERLFGAGLGARGGTPAPGRRATQSGRGLSLIAPSSGQFTGRGLRDAPSRRPCLTGRRTEAGSSWGMKATCLDRSPGAARNARQRCNMCASLIE